MMLRWSISKMEAGLQELDETDYWLELLSDGKIYQSPQVDALLTETNELISIFVTMVKNAKNRE